MCHFIFLGRFRFRQIIEKIFPTKVLELDKSTDQLCDSGPLRALICLFFLLLHYTSHLHSKY